MEYSRISEVISSDLLPQSGSVSRDFGISKSGLQNKIRLSSSLQDFSVYRQFDPNEGHVNLEIDRSLSQADQLRPLKGNNAGSSFSKEKALSGGTSFMHKKWVRVIVLLLCLLLFSFLIYMFAAYLYPNWSGGTSKFYVVLDCGSTGTRVYVYQASTGHKKESSLPFVLRSSTAGVDRKSTLQHGRAYDRMETEPGLDKLVHNVSGLRAAVLPLLLWAEKQIPKHSHETTRLFLHATAGVRRLPSADSKWLLDNARSILKHSSFLCEGKWVKIISGVEEAYYGWIALNYHTGMFEVSPKKETFGALDLGGSSLQVTFESKEHVHNETNLKLKIGAVNHNLSAYSLSGYGLNDAFDKSVVQLFKRLPEITKTEIANGKKELGHPCLQSGYKEQYTCSRCASSDKEGGSPVNGGKILDKGGKPGIPLQLVGAPNWIECSALAKVTINLSEWSNLSPGFDCDLQPCALPAGLPRPYGHFYAMSGFFVVYRFFNLTSEAALDDVLEKGQEFCEKTWEVAKYSVSPQPFIEQYCFRAPYIVLLLREGLHITDSQIVIASGSITWTLGVALLEAGKDFSTRVGIRNYEILQMTINPIILIAILFISLIFLVCALSCVVKWIPRFFHRLYLPLLRHQSASSTSGLSMPSLSFLQRWNLIRLGDGRVKMPLSPTVAGAQQTPFGLGQGLGGSSIQLMESSLYPPTSSMSHSYSSNSLGQMQFDGGSMASFWTPHRSQMHLQSRRSQSREDLISSLNEATLGKV